MGWASGDWSLTFHPLVPTVYGSFALVTWIGTGLADQRTFAPITLGTLAGSALFFVVTNFATQALLTTYTKTWEGLVAC